MGNRFKTLIQIFRYTLAIVFIFSGFVKGVDPLGSAYKFSDYFKAFHADFFEPLTIVFSFILCAAELLIGLMLLFGVKMRLAAWGAFLFMVVFTPLTFILALFNPVSDCGCFGDAIKLTNWETFYKNIFFLVAAIFLLVSRKTLESNLKNRTEWLLVAMLILISLAPSWYGFNHLPLINFRPYKIGVNIPEAMRVPEDAPVDEYKTIFYYQKNGEIKEFDENNYPWQDSTWKFVDSKSTLVRKGFTPPVENFNLFSLYGNDITDSIINHRGYYFLVIAKEIQKVKPGSAEQMNQLYLLARDKGYSFAVITSSSRNQIDDFATSSGALYPFINADEVLLKTIIRSNPGLMIIKDGTIIGKWHYHDIPPVEYFKGNLLATQLLQMNKLATNRAVYIILSLLVSMFILKLVIVDFKKRG